MLSVVKHFGLCPELLRSYLEPCYGIHILVQNHFDSEEDSKWWYNHFAMLNTRSYKPLVSHWHLYYIELKKFLECLKDKSPMTELEQWTYFLGTIQDNTKPLDEKVRDNKAIQEVHDMLQTFTKDDRLREQYRLREEFLRDQLTAKAETDKLRQEHLKALQEKKSAQEAEKAAQQEKKLAQEAEEVAQQEKKAAQEAEEVAQQEKKSAQEAEKAAQEAEKQERNEKEQLLAKFVNSMYQNGSTKQEIARELDVSMNLVDAILSE